MSRRDLSSHRQPGPLTSTTTTTQSQQQQPERRQQQQHHHHHGQHHYQQKQHQREVETRHERLVFFGMGKFFFLIPFYCTNEYLIRLRTTTKGEVGTAASTTTTSLDNHHLTRQLPPHSSPRHQDVLTRLPPRVYHLRDYHLVSASTTTPSASATPAASSGVRDSTRLERFLGGYVFFFSFFFTVLTNI